MTKEEKLYRLPGGTVIKLKMKTPEQVIRDKGLDKVGDAQQFHTANVLRRIKRYMPFRTGMTYKVTVAQTDIHKPMIVTNTPYAQYLYHGKVMAAAKEGKGLRFVPGVGFRFRKGATLIPTKKDLVYTRTKNPSAGPYWDRALVAAEGKALAADLQRYIQKKK